jgi:2-polyprenyl-6-hydroxyphenyl methylase/3-demethylubiquinone-9 3-methyltransferase
MNRALVQHRTEVSSGKRFEFGKNWARFLRKLNDRRLALAEQSLKKMLDTERLDGKSFLDIGSGSGLFSLAARRLGARVHSFDYDPESVACTAELRRRYFPSADNWTVESGSALDRDYLARLGTFDIVYSWGVLHHTGDMWQALQNVKPLVADRGQLYIAIYNDLGDVTDSWAKVKRRYNALPRPLSFVYAIGIVAGEEWRALRHPIKWFENVRNYAETSTRGMNWWRDNIDWIGGLPYERASVEGVVDVFSNDGFALTGLVDRSGGYGCNEFLFERQGPPGTVIPTRLPGGLSFVRRYGRQVSGPYVETAEGYLGRIPGSPFRRRDAGFVLLKNRRLMGPVRLRQNDSVLVAPAGKRPDASDVFHIAEGFTRQPEHPFTFARGRMWIWPVPALACLADNVLEPPNSSPVFVFEDGVQLPWPRSLHVAIEHRGAGRFSHWGNELLFAPTDNANPNSAPARFTIVVATEDLTDDMYSRLRARAESGDG